MLRRSVVRVFASSGVVIAVIAWPYPRSVARLTRREAQIGAGSGTFRAARSACCGSVSTTTIMRTTAGLSRCMSAPPAKIRARANRHNQAHGRAAAAPSRRSGMSRFPRKSSRVGLAHASVQQSQRYLNVTEEELRKGLEVGWKRSGLSSRRWRTEAHAVGSQA